MYNIYEMFPNIPSKRINVLYHEVCHDKLDGLVEVLLSLDPNEIQFTDEIVEDQVSLSRTTNLTRYDLSRVVNKYLDSSISDLEKDYLQAVKIRKMTFDEYGIYEEEEEIENEFDHINIEELPEAEREWYYEMKLKKEKLKQERAFIKKKMREEKRSRNVRFYCKGEEDLLNSERREIYRYQLYRNPTFEFEAEYIHFRIVESQFDRLMYVFSSMSNY